MRRGSAFCAFSAPWNSPAESKGATGTLSQLLDTDAIFVIGVDPLEETPALGWQVKTAARRYDSNVIVANSRSTSLDRFARVRLRIRPYSESDLVLGIMKIILDSGPLGQEIRERPDLEFPFHEKPA